MKVEPVESQLPPVARLPVKVDPVVKDNVPAVPGPPFMLTMADEFDRLKGPVTPDPEVPVVPPLLLTPTISSAWAAAGANKASTAAAKMY